MQGRMINMIMLMLVIEISMFFLLGQSGIISPIFNFFNNPTSFHFKDIITNPTSLTIIGIIALALAAATVQGVQIGSFAIRVNENAPYATLAITFLPFTATFIALYSQMASLDLCGIELAECKVSQVFAGIIIIPLAIYYLWCCLEFARGRD